MGKKFISISDEAYSRLTKMMGENQSFTDIIDRLTRIGSLSDLILLLRYNEANSLEQEIGRTRQNSRARLNFVSKRLEMP